MLVDEESQREAGANGVLVQKKGFSCPVCVRVFEYILPSETQRCPFGGGKAFKRASHPERHHSVHRAGGEQPHSRCSAFAASRMRASWLSTSVDTRGSVRSSAPRAFQCPQCPLARLPLYRAERITEVHSVEEASLKVLSWGSQGLWVS